MKEAFEKEEWYYKFNNDLMRLLFLLGGGEPVGYQKLDVSTNVVELTIPSEANRAVIVCEEGKIRFRDDGGDPASDEGMPLFINQGLEVKGETALEQFKAIRAETSDATLYILYYKR